MVQHEIPAHAASLTTPTPSPAFPAPSQAQVVPQQPSETLAKQLQDAALEVDQKLSPDMLVEKPAASQTPAKPEEKPVEDKSAGEIPLRKDRRPDEPEDTIFIDQDGNLKMRS